MNLGSRRAGFLVVGLLTCFASGARAQTVAPGPYYATPSWDQTLPCVQAANCPRFVVLSNMSGEAVLDRETGLVWQKSPTTTVTFDWFVAKTVCAEAKTGGRMGWRLPSLSELLSLLEANTVAGSPPALPAGHPFDATAGFGYWSANISESVTFGKLVWVVQFRPGTFSSPGPAFASEDSRLPVWCVRGSMGIGHY